MTIIEYARLTMDVLFSASNAALAIILVNETRWHSLLPALFMYMLLARLDRVEHPNTCLLATAIVACVIVLVAHGSRLRTLRLAAIVICAASTATLHVVDRL